MYNLRATSNYRGFVHPVTAAERTSLVNGLHLRQYGKAILVLCSSPVPPLTLLCYPIPWGNDAPVQVLHLLLRCVVTRVDDNTNRNNYTFQESTALAHGLLCCTCCGVMVPA